MSDTDDRIDFDPLDPVVGRRPDENDFTNREDIIRNYDQAMTDLLTVWVPHKSLGRIYGIEELDSFNINDLRALAAKLGVYQETNRKEVLIKSCLNAQRVPVVFATPSPAYANQERVTGRVEGTTTQTVRYPIISVQRMPIQDDQRRFSRPARRRIVWTPDGNSVLQAWQPNPVIIPYQIEFIAQTMAHMNIFNAWVERLFTFPVAIVNVDLGFPWSTRRIQMVREGSFVDATDYEQAAEDAEKFLRYVYTFSMEGWIPTTMWRTPTVRRLAYEFADGDEDSSETLETISTELENTYISDSE